jgi:hypothetical protein
MSRRPSYQEFCFRSKRLPVPGTNCHRPEACLGERAIGFERALNHRQQDELGRQAALLDLLHDVIEVDAAALEHPLQIFAVRRVFARPAAGERAVQVRHGEALADTGPEVLLRVRHRGI